MQKHRLLEETEVAYYEALLRDARLAKGDEKREDDVLEAIEITYRSNYISDEMVRYLTDVLCK